MGVKPTPNGDRPPALHGGERLRATARRLGAAIKFQHPDPCPDQPQPISEWGRDAEDRLCALEQKLANQNRLLLFSLVAIVADVIAKVATRSGP